MKIEIDEVNWTVTVIGADRLLITGAAFALARAGYGIYLRSKRNPEGGHDAAFKACSTFDMSRQLGRVEGALRALAILQNEERTCPICGGAGEARDTAAHFDNPSDALTTCMPCDGTGVEKPEPDYKAERLGAS